MDNWRVEGRVSYRGREEIWINQICNKFKNINFLMSIFKSIWSSSKVLMT